MHIHTQHRMLHDVNIKWSHRIQIPHDLWVFEIGGSSGPGREKHLIVGNHDGELTQRLPWTSVSQLTEIKDGEQRNVLCHYPMITWNGARRDDAQLFDHVHGQWLGSGNAVNVGVDVWDYMPVALADIRHRAAGFRSTGTGQIWSAAPGSPDISITPTNGRRQVNAERTTTTLRQEKPSWTWIFMIWKGCC